MIRERPQEKVDSILAKFEKIDTTRIQDVLHDKLSRRAKVESPTTSRDVHTVTVDVIDGFEDLFTEPLGAGFWQNTQTTLWQLTFALSVSKNPVVEQILKQEISPRERILKFRQQKPLSNLRIVDLGCGSVPSFALAAKAFGATVYTADADEIYPDDKARLDGHIVTDFRDKNSAHRIEEITGGNLDIVTERIVSALPTQGRLQAPEAEVVARIGHELLKVGGYLYYSPKLSDMIALRKIK